MRPELIIEGYVAGQPEQLTLAYSGQCVRPIDHRVTLSKPALVSAPSKKSFSRGSWPIFASRVLSSGASEGVFVPPNMSVAWTSSCDFHAVI